MADLIELTDLASYLQQDLDEETAVRARRVASGWLRSATALTAWPDPVPDDLWTWALELAAMAYSNPEMLSSETAGGTVSTTDRSRRQAILDAARQAYGVGRGPLYSFPEPDWSWTTTTTGTCTNG